MENDSREKEAANGSTRRSSMRDAAAPPKGENARQKSEPAGDGGQEL